MPAKSGKVAKTMGTAPLKPTHDKNAFSELGILKKLRLVNTLMGRATRIKNKEIRSPMPITFKSSEADTRSPRLKNKIICISQAKPSNTFKTVRL